jgi:hypothetical protein
MLTGGPWSQNLSVEQRLSQIFVHRRVKVGERYAGLERRLGVPRRPASDVKYALNFHIYTTRLTCVGRQHLTTGSRVPAYRTSKNLFNHHTWKIPSPISTPNWKIDHHLTLAFVLSAVFLCVRSLTTMYDCSSLTCERRSESFLTISCQLLLRGAQQGD